MGSPIGPVVEVFVLLGILGLIANRRAFVWGSDVDTWVARGFLERV